jgi:CelD/BcsL family acetyltransferase involved in cellulose biosynthesis
VNIVAQTLTTLDDMDVVRSAWRALWRRAAAATIFQSPDWLIPWWRHFAPGQLTCIALWQGKELVGIAPLYREDSSRRLLPLGVSLSDCLDVLFAEEILHNARHAMQVEIARAAGAGEICFPDVVPNASVLGLALNGCSTRRRPGQPSPELVLGPGDNPLKNVPAHQRQNLRTAENRARRRGCAIDELVADELPRFIPALMQLHSARQRQLGHGGLDQDARVLPFFSEAFGPLAHEGVVRAYSIACEGRLIGGYLGFLHRGRASYYLGGFDPEFTFESPGTILIGHAMRCAAAEGAHTFDFLRGAEPYKYAWGARDRRLLSLSFVPQVSDVELAS